MTLKKEMPHEPKDFPTGREYPIRDISVCRSDYAEGPLQGRRKITQAGKVYEAFDELQKALDAQPNK